MATFLMLLALAVTSTTASIRRLGRRWTQLHRLIYVAATTALIHFWLVEEDGGSHEFEFLGGRRCRSCSGSVRGGPCAFARTRGRPSAPL